MPATKAADALVLQLSQARHPAIRTGPINPALELSLLRQLDAQLMVELVGVSELEVEELDAQRADTREPIEPPPRELVPLTCSVSPHGPPRRARYGATRQRRTCAREGPTAT